MLRPADAEETFIAWKIALLQKDRPSCLLLSRQNLPHLDKADAEWQNTILHGAYIVKDCAGTPDITIVATGSEVSLACEAAQQLSTKKIRVVSMLSKELFEAQPASFREGILGSASVRVVVVEAGVKQGWEGYTRSDTDIFSIERFGESGPAKKVAEYLSFTVEKLVQRLSVQDKE